MAKADAARAGRATKDGAELKAANLRHLKRIEGQVRGVAAMIEDDRYCADVITQIAAVRESLNSVARSVMRNHLRHCAAKALSVEGRGRELMVNELLDLVRRITG
jgi:DNA-binding FrmR family transcriptional regulator